MNVNDLHPKFQLDLIDTEKNPDIIEQDKDGNDIVLSDKSSLMTFSYFNISFSEFPTKTGGTYSLNTRQLTFTSIETTPPSSFSATIDLNVNPFYPLEYIEFTFEDGTTSRGVNGNTFIFTRIGSSKTYLVNDTSGSRATKIIGKIRGFPSFLSQVEFSKNMVLSTTDITPNDKHKILYFNYYPSGLMLKAAVRKDTNTTFTCNLLKHCLSSSNSGNKVYSLKGLSPIPKTYCFFDSNNTNVWTITSGSGNYDSNSKLYRGDISISQQGNYYYFSDVAATIYFNTMFFIDPLLGDYRDQKTVNEDQTENDVALYPIYKIDSTDTYGINNINLSGTYNFLTSYGALYQYPGNLNRLKEGYVTTHAKSNSQFNVSQTKSTTSEIDNRGVIPTFDAELHYQYGSVINKAILKDNGFKENNDRFRNNDNVNVIQDNQQGKCLYGSRAQEPSLLGLDEYHLGLKDKQVFRIPIGYNVALLKRTPSNVDTSKVPQQSVSTNFDYAYTGFNLSLALSTRSVDVRFHYGECNNYITGEHDTGSPYCQSYFKTNYSYTQQILNRNTNQGENDSVNSGGNTNTDQITRQYQYNIFFNGYHIVSQRESTLVRVGDYGLPHYNNTPYKETVYYGFIFTTNNFYYPLYTTVTSNEDNIPTYSATQTYTDSYTSSYEQGGNARIVHDTDYLRVINYYYKKNSPTKVGAGLLFHARQDPDLIPNFAYNLIDPNLAQGVTLKNDSGDDVSEYVGAASVDGSKVAAVTMDIDATGSRSTGYVCIKPN